MKRIIIDTDAGVDDALAILLAFGQKDVKIEAFTTVNGNVDVDKTTANVLKILDLVGQDVPVYRGCPQPLVAPVFNAASIHGVDGLGDAGIPASKRQPEKKHAALALVDLANQYPGEISLIAIGPLTNLAAALTLDPDLPHKFADLTIMGGAIYARGNTNVTAEFNIYADAEAARVVFERWPKVRVLSWETTMLYPFNGEQVAHFFNMGTAKSKFFHDIYQKTLGFLREKFHQDLLFSADGLAVACAIDPSIITRKEEHFMEVELHGASTRGLTAVDWFGLGGKPANAEIILELDHARYVQMIEDGLR
ncbi:MAG: nucleoside hydrolase [Anaerolineae bacterium]|nr:nucleoside hydrolase [Anaerolineae bacterium]